MKITFQGSYFYLKVRHSIPYFCGVFFQTKGKDKVIFFVVKWFVFNIKNPGIWIFFYIVLDKIVLITKGLNSTFKCMIVESFNVKIS